MHLGQTFLTYWKQKFKKIDYEIYTRYGKLDLPKIVVCFVFSFFRNFDRT